MTNAPTPSPRRGFTLVELMIVVAIVGILAALAVYGVRKYIINAKTAEARNSLGQISKDAATAFEKESISSAVLTGTTTAAVVRALCASSSVSVPSSSGQIQGKKYQSNQAPGVDWSIDASTNKGFSCLKFSMSMPQYYMYSYASDGNLAATPPSAGTYFSAIANGDLTGNGVLSTFSIVGAVTSNNLYIAPNIATIDPEE